MGFFRFRRSVKIAPGIRLNVSKSGLSTSIGARGAKVTIGHGRVRQTVGIPGTGVSYTESHRLGGSHDARPVDASAGSDGAGTGTLLALCIFVVVAIAAGATAPHVVIGCVVVYFAMAILRGFNSGRQAAPETARTSSMTEADMHAGNAVLDHNQPWLHERWLRADAAHKSGAHGGEFPRWYFDPVTEPQLERIHRMHLSVSGGELTKGAASDLIGLFEPMDDGDAEVCQFFHVEVPLECRNQSRGRMEAARLFADPANVAKWEQRDSVTAQ